MYTSKRTKILIIKQNKKHVMRYNENQKLKLLKQIKQLITNKNKNKE